MRIGGLQKCSLIDYPGQVAVVIFTQGCNFRCPYCHNRDLVLPEEFGDPIPEEEVLNFLLSRRRYLDAAVVSGGEPTEQEDLIPFLEKIKAMGFLVKLDTNGSRPPVVKDIVRRGMADYIAMDIKTTWEKYPKAIGVDFPVEKIRETAEFLKTAGIDHEFRTTVVEPFCGFEDVRRIAAELKGTGVYRLQSFQQSGKLINSRLAKIRQRTPEEVESWRQSI